MHLRPILATLAGTVIVCAMTPAAAAPLLDSNDAVVNSGHTLFQVHCARCHGEDARGGGADAVRATVKVPDLTTLAARNGGTFPWTRLYDTVSGTELLPAHGTRVMPIWGDALQSEPGVSEPQAQSIVRGRILSILVYLSTLQSH